VISRMQKKVAMRARGEAQPKCEKRERKRRRYLSQQQRGRSTVEVWAERKETRLFGGFKTERESKGVFAVEEENEAKGKK